MKEASPEEYSTFSKYYSAYSTLKTVRDVKPESMGGRRALCSCCCELCEEDMLSSRRCCLPLAAHHLQHLAWCVVWTGILEENNFSLRRCFITCIPRAIYILLVLHALTMTGWRGTLLACQTRNMDRTLPRLSAAWCWAFSAWPHLPSPTPLTIHARRTC